MVKWIDSTSCDPCFDILWCYTSSVGFFEQPQPFPLVYHVVWTSRHEFTANTVEGPVQRTVDGLVQRTALAIVLYVKGMQRGECLPSLLPQEGPGFRATIGYQESGPGASLYHNT